MGNEIPSERPRFKTRIYDTGYSLIPLPNKALILKTHSPNLKSLCLFPSPLHPPAHEAHLLER